MVVFIFLIIGLFIALLFLNVYFRVKVFKLYKFLVQHEVEFDLTHMINSNKMDAEVLKRYPQYRSEITDFVRHIKYSMKIAVALIILITLIGGILMYLK